MLWGWAAIDSILFLPSAKFIWRSTASWLVPTNVFAKWRILQRRTKERQKNYPTSPGTCSFILHLYHSCSVMAWGRRTWTSFNLISSNILPPCSSAKDIQDSCGNAQSMFTYTPPRGMEIWPCTFLPTTDVCELTYTVAKVRQGDTEIFLYSHLLLITSSLSHLSAQWFKLQFSQLKI